MSVILHKMNKFANEISQKLKEGPRKTAGFLGTRAQDYAVRLYTHGYDAAHALRVKLNAHRHGGHIVHVIGDSHTGPFSGSTKTFIVYPIGPATAYNLKKDNTTTRSKEQLWNILKGVNKKKDIVMMVFGEVDCRIHVYKQYKKNKEKITIYEIIGKTIESYGEALTQIIDQGYGVVVYGVPPAARQENIYGMEYYAPPKMRARINREFNNSLRIYCKENNIPYFDVYSWTVDENGFIKEEYAQDEVHINKKIKPAVEEWLKKEVFNRQA